MANFGESFSNSFISGYSAGKALRDDWAARDLKDDLEAAKAKSKKDLEEGLAGNKKTYDDTVAGLSTYTPEEMGEISSKYDAALETQGASDLADTEKALKDVYNVPQYDANDQPIYEKDASGKLVQKRVFDQEGYDRALSDARGEVADYRAKQMDRLQDDFKAPDRARTRALMARNDADAETRRKVRNAEFDAQDTAWRKYYGTTGKTEKLSELDELKKFRDLANNPEEMRNFLLEEYNSKLPNGEKMVIAQDGTILHVDANGRQMGDPIPMPSMAVQRQMLANAMADRMLFSPNAAVAERAYKYSALANDRTKLEATAAKNAAEIKKNLSQAAYNEARIKGTIPSSGSGSSSGSGGSGGLYYGEKVDIGNGRIAQPVKAHKNGPDIGVFSPTDNLFVEAHKLGQKENPDPIGSLIKERNALINETKGRGTLEAFRDPSTNTIGNVYKDVTTGRMYTTRENLIAALNGDKTVQAREMTPQERDAANTARTRAAIDWARARHALPQTSGEKSSGGQTGGETTTPEPTKGELAGAQTAGQFNGMDVGASAKPDENSAVHKFFRALAANDKPENVVDNFGPNAGTKKGSSSNALRSVSKSNSPAYEPGKDFGSRALRAGQNAAKAIQARGVRNNNPLNIKDSEKNNWRGKSGSDGTFVKFNSKEDGARAGMKVLGANIKAVSKAGKGEFTITDLINRFAPKSDGNDTSSYSKIVAKALGNPLSHKYTITDFNPETKQGKANIVALATAMAKVETGDTKVAQEYRKFFEKYASEAYQSK